MAAATQSWLPHNLHMRIMNAHVAASLESQNTAAGSARANGCWVIPRQPAPGACLPLTPLHSHSRGSTPTPALVGASGFAFQGTNAHVLLEASPVSTAPLQLASSPRPAALSDKLASLGQAAALQASGSSPAGVQASTQTTWGCRWQMQALWLLPPPAQLVQRAGAAATLPVMLRGAEGREAVFETWLAPCAGARLAWLYDHVVSGKG